MGGEFFLFPVSPSFLSGNKLRMTSDAGELPSPRFFPPPPRFWLLPPLPPNFVGLSASHDANARALVRSSPAPISPPLSSGHSNH